MPSNRGKVRSRAQWRWMFASKQRFAHKWASARKRTYGKKTDFQTLPPRKGIRRR
ncbi:hypothetical protein ACL07V_37405 [Streptomyces sp. MB22_4]|uniref:hypothetical protein n=1 Tax=Streptomyces sp. MB22_4 TaxID=3383120 RepID=UPI0039A34729